MLKAQCDSCQKYFNVLTATRRWENIVGNLGLEIVVLSGSSPVSDQHICDDCVISMIMKRSGKAQERHLQDTNLTHRESVCRDLEKSLEDRHKKLDLLFDDYYDKNGNLIIGAEIELYKIYPKSITVTLIDK